MPVTLYEASVPAFETHLAALSGLLDKGVKHAEAKRFDPRVLLESRLYPDMFNLTRQVQVACDFATRATARLAGIPIPSQPDTETTVDELKARIATTIAFVRSVGPDAMEGAEDRELTIKVGADDMTFTGRSYLLGFALPNFYFHCTAAYAILRHNGVEIGKRDFMGRAPQA